MVLQLKSRVGQRGGKTKGTMTHWKIQSMMTCTSCLPTGLKVKWKCQYFLILCYSIYYNLTGCSMEFSRKEYWSGYPVTSAGDLPNSGTKSESPALQVDSLPLEQPGKLKSNQIRSDQLLSRVWIFLIPWISARQASLSITKSRSSLTLTSIVSVMPSSHLILCHPLVLLPPIPSSISLFQWVNSSHEVAKVLEFQL